jgi:hypothetical protein
MAVKHVQTHLKKIQSHHARHKQKVLAAFHKIRKHPGSYKPGFKPSKAKAPKSIPRQPAGLNKKAAGLWSWVKKGWSHVKKIFDAHKGKIYAEGRKLVGAYVREQGSRVRNYAVSRAREVGTRVHNRAEHHVRSYVEKGENKVRQIGSKVDSTIEKYLPKGSGFFVIGGRRRGLSRQQARARTGAAPIFAGKMLGNLARAVGRARRF